MLCLPEDRRETFGAKIFRLASGTALASPPFLGSAKSSLTTRPLGCRHYLRLCVGTAGCIASSLAVGHLALGRILLPCCLKQGCSRSAPPHSPELSPSRKGGWLFSERAQRPSGQAFRGRTFSPKCGALHPDSVWLQHFSTNPGLNAPVNSMRGPCTQTLSKGNLWDF